MRAVEYKSWYWQERDSVTIEKMTHMKLLTALLLNTVGPIFLQDAAKLVPVYVNNYGKADHTPPQQERIGSKVNLSPIFKSEKLIQERCCVLLDFFTFDISLDTLGKTT